MNAKLINLAMSLGGNYANEFLNNIFCYNNSLNQQSVDK